MSTALYPVLETEIDNIDVSLVNGKALNAVCDVLESAAAKLGVKSLMSFYGADMSDFLEAEGQTDFETGEKWFAANDGFTQICQ